ncbi:hypothetical protein ACFL5G_02230 [Candidatus Margulisiibacteriota bacterium]
MKKQEQGFVLITVLIVVFVLSTLGLTRLLLSASRTSEINGHTQDLKLLALAESGISLAQANATDLSGVNNVEFFLGDGSYIVIGDTAGLIKTVTVNSFIPNQANSKQTKMIVISGESITNNYTWQEL